MHYDRTEIVIITDTRLAHLLSVVHHRNFGLAAAALGISQPALSKSIQGLEAALGVQLLDRERGGVVATVFGEMVMQQGGEILRKQAEMLRSVRMLDNLETGSVKAKFGPYPSVISGYSAAARLLKKYPGLRVSLQVTGWREVLSSVIAGQVDFGIAELNEWKTDTRLEVEVLAQHTGRLFCHPEHPLRRQPQIALADALQYPWAGTRFPPRIADLFPREPCAAGQIDPFNGDFVPSVNYDVPMHLDSFAAGGSVLVFASLALVEPAIKAQTLVPLPGLEVNGRYGLLRLKSHSLSPATLAFIAEIRAVEAEFSQREQYLEQLYRELITPKNAKAPAPLPAGIPPDQSER